VFILYVDSPASLHDVAAHVRSETATFAGGCFWGVEHIFLKEYPPAQNKGILKTSVGYTGGKESAQNPTYRELCDGTTNHAEALKIDFDPSIIQYGELVGELIRPVPCRIV
jgi:peptide-methionine (S)-S-oxide reductase